MILGILIKAVEIESNMNIISSRSSYEIVII